jgi:hypothetical protein
MKQVPAVVSVAPSTTILTAQARAATTTTGQKETATAQVTTGDGTTFDNSIRMDNDVESNAAAAVAHMEHLIAYYQQAHPTPALRADIAHSQSRDPIFHMSAKKIILMMKKNILPNGMSCRKGTTWL